VLVYEHGPAAGATIEDFDTGLAAAFEIDDRRQAVAQPQTDDYCARRRNPPALNGLVSSADVRKKSFVAQERLTGLFGW
jgi:hypothetical protein